MKLRGDLSAPVLAIIVTIGVIAAGLVLLAWFWWFAPQAGKAGSLQILGQPSLVYQGITTGGGYNYTAYISVKNTGNDNVEITSLVVKSATCTIKSGTTKLDPGSSTSLVAECIYTSDLTDYAVQGVIYTNYGTYVANFAVIK